MKWFDVHVLNGGIRLRAAGDSAQDVKVRFESELQRIVSVSEEFTEDGWHGREDGTEARHHPSREPAKDGETHTPVGDVLVLHVFKDGRSDGDDTGDWTAWLNTEVSDFDGLCLAVGEDRLGVLSRVREVGNLLTRAADSVWRKE